MSGVPPQPNCAEDEPLEKIVVYIHGQGGSGEEAARFRPLFPGCAVIGFDYTAQTPWEAREEFPRFFDSIGGRHGTVTVIANSIGAFFAMASLSERQVEKAYFISPVVNIEKLITDSMAQARVGEEELREKGVVKTPSGQVLSWDYLSYVRNHPIAWRVPTHILYGERDSLTSPETIAAFAGEIGATLTVMENGEHWFHTEEQLEFLDDWIASLR